MGASSSREHRVGDAIVTIDVNVPQSTTPLEVRAGQIEYGPIVRDLIFRVRRGTVVSAYRCQIADTDLPKEPYDVAAYLLTQAHRGSFLFAYTESLAVVRK